MTKVTVTQGRAVRKTSPGIVVAMQIVTKYSDRETFIERFGRMVDADGMLVAAKSNRAPGSRMPFVVKLADLTKMLEGDAEVMRPPDGDADATRLRFIHLTAESHALLAEMLRRKSDAPRWVQAGAARNRGQSGEPGAAADSTAPVDGTRTTPSLMTPSTSQTTEIDMPSEFPELLAASTGFCAGCTAYKLGYRLTGRTFVACPLPPGSGRSGFSRS